MIAMIGRLIEHGNAYAGDEHVELILRDPAARIDRACDVTDIIDNVSFYWLSGTAISSARLYWDNNATRGC